TNHRSAAAPPISCDGAHRPDVTLDWEGERRTRLTHEGAIRVVVHAAGVPRNVLEIAQERPADRDREVTAKRRSQRVQTGDDRLIEQSVLPHRQRERVAIRAAIAPLAGHQQPVSADVRVSIFEIRQTAFRKAAADDHWDFIHRREDETYAVSAVRDRAQRYARDVRLLANDARDFWESTVL